MRHAILSDVHANLPALQAVLADARASDAAHVACLGDLVGYHGFVNETLTLLRTVGATCVAGNHDLMALGWIPATSCGPNAQRGIAWAQATLTPDARAFLCDLPLMERLDDRTILVHALPWSTETRMRDGADFAAAARVCRLFAPGGVCFTGHTHAAGAVCVAPDNQVTVLDIHGGLALPLPGAASFWFINPGSVGEPRDGRTGASYALFDDDARTVQFRRVRYPRRAVEARDADCGLAAVLPRGGRVTSAWRAVRDVSGRLARV